jgi:hypothetical protein
MTLIDTNDRWLLKLPSALPIVSFIPFARALEDRLSRRTPILPIVSAEVAGCVHGLLQGVCAFMRRELRRRRRQVA